jgi:hypothetical protein
MGPKRNAEALLVELLHERDTGVERPVGNMTELSVSNARIRRAEPGTKTQSAYRDVIRNHLVPAFRSFELIASRPSDILSLSTELLGHLEGRTVTTRAEFERDSAHGSICVEAARPAADNGSRSRPRRAAC